MYSGPGGKKGPEWCLYDVFEFRSLLRDIKRVTVSKPVVIITLLAYQYMYMNLNFFG